MTNKHTIKRENLTNESWNKIEKEFLSNLSDYFSDINNSINLLRKNKTEPFVRSQLCLALIGADTFSRFQRIFDGERDEVELDKNNERRLKKWFNSYVFVEENETYRKDKSRIRCDSGVIWRIRNSFLHFYSFPKPTKDGKRVGLFWGISDEQHNRMVTGLKDKGDKVQFIDVYCLTEAILQGFVLQVQTLRKMIEQNPNEYIDAVLFVYPIVMQGNAKTILIPKK